MDSWLLLSEILGCEKHQEMERELVELLDDNEIGEVIAWGLGINGYEGVERHIAKGLYAGDPYVIWRCAEALRDVGSKEAIRYLTKPLYEQSVSEDTKWRCVWALGEIGSLESFDDLWRALTDESKYTRWESTKALIKLGEQTTDKILEEIEQTTNPYLIWRGMYIISKIKPRNKDKVIGLFEGKVKRNLPLLWQYSRLLEEMVNEEDN